MKDSKQSSCPDCDGNFSRRDFVKTSTAALVAGGVLGSGALANAAPTPESKAETAVKHFYESLSDKQKKEICFPFNHKLRSRISANWHITKPVIDDEFYTDDQRKILESVVKGVTSEEGFEKLNRQMDDDDGGFGAYSVAVFGEPGSGKFQWELTGRHLTLRADGDSVKNAAFGGPIVYGHGEEDIKHNLFYDQTKKVNEVYAALDEKQRTQALVAKAPRESAVPIQGKGGKFPGISVSELSDDQKELVESTIKKLLSPYRKEDVDEVIAVLKKTGGLDKLNLAFYKQGDIGKDEVWDIWRLEGPSFVWHFRGAPHVHTYVNIGIKS